ncbi:hypothetical protein FOLKNPGA_01244 [Legionella sp. PC1000]|uniref:HGGxSTG domain-containing protein n=1 Tax=Legionella sp. PC1000 TaxID=2746060 RepID=UPI0015F91AF8|nr:HGGxSTG domain-containing protein [Legionella sp. PC1000]QLZ68465.1 hypothetical protein FOLKNPGA_01244 [Legionella sp. PC1000]
MKNEINPIQADNTSSYPFQFSPRCGAKTRQGTSCKAPAVSNKKRCRMHGGASGSGAPQGNKNALSHGHTTVKAKAIRKVVSQVIKESRKLAQEIG